MGLIILLIVLAIIVLIVFYAIGLYNSLVQLNNKVEEAFSTMDVYLKKRWDMIPNLVETVKGYAKHEKETLASVIAARNGAYENMSAEEKIAANQELSKGIVKIMALAEQYPELKANDNFQKLMTSLETVENDIASSRKYYNATVKTYNNKVQMFPSNIFAKMFGYSVKKMFEIAEAERENVKVEF